MQVCGTMPLPKSCSMAARATEAYAEAWSVVLNECWGVAPHRDEPLPPLVQLLPFIRQLLTCCACAGLLEDAMISLSCGHCYCSKCQQGTPLLKIQCRQCKERTGLVVENQIRLVVNCYRHMCHILSDFLAEHPNSTLHQGEFTLAKNKEIPVGFNPVTEILVEVVEGVKVSRTVLFVLPPPKYLNPKPPPETLPPRKEQVSPAIVNPPPPPTPPSALPGPSGKQASTSQEEEPLIDVTGTTPESPLLLKATPPQVKEKKEREAGPTKSDKKQILVGTTTSTKTTTPKKSKKSKLVDVPSALFHGSVDFFYSRPASRRGTMRLFFSLKLLRLKQATLPCAESNPEVNVECINQEHISPGNLCYYLRPEVPSTALLPPPYRTPSSSCIPDFATLLRTDSSKSQIPTAVGGKRSLRQITLRPRNPLTPRAKYRILRRKYKSPYLSYPQSLQQQQQQQKRSKPTHLLTKAELAPLSSSSSSSSIPSNATLAQCNISLCSPNSEQVLTAPPAAKKKKRSPLTPGKWRCRCGTNNPQTFDRICARGKCPCFAKGMGCNKCLCRHCKNPFNSSPTL